MVTCNCSGQDQAEKVENFKILDRARDAHNNILYEPFDKRIGDDQDNLL